MAKGGSWERSLASVAMVFLSVMPAAVSGASEEYSSLLSLQNRADKLKEVEAELELRKEVRCVGDSEEILRKICWFPYTFTRILRKFLSSAELQHCRGVETAVNSKCKYFDRSGLKGVAERRWLMVMERWCISSDKKGSADVATSLSLSNTFLPLGGLSWGRGRVELLVVVVVDSMPVTLRRSDWGFFRCGTSIKVDEMSGCLSKVGCGGKGIDCIEMLP